jgi:hypothetical protein
MPDSFFLTEVLFFFFGSGTSCSKDNMDRQAKRGTVQKNLNLSNVHIGVGCDSCGVKFRNFSVISQAYIQ